MTLVATGATDSSPAVAAGCEATGGSDADGSALSAGDALAPPPAATRS
ncbi:MAG TPA: hypothetical protein VL738_27105 [Dactylosporangium sp.]|nr:hypothetical protein [Dactylosporangium sp.]